MERSENALTENSETDFYLDLLVLSWRSSSTEEICLPRPPVGFCCRKLSRDTLAVEWDPRSESSRLLPAPPETKSIHPTTVVARHKQQQRRRLVDLLRHINMLWAKGAAALRAVRARRRTDPALFRGRFRTGAHSRNFPRRSKSTWRYLTPGKVAPPAIMWRGEASGKVSRQATARQDNKKRPWWKELLESLGSPQDSHQQLPRLSLIHI